MKKCKILCLFLFVLATLFSSLIRAQDYNKYAIIISAGDASVDEVYWNDLFLAYEALVNNDYGHNEIFVCYGYGTDYTQSRYPKPGGWPANITDYPCTKDDIESCFDYVNCLNPHHLVIYWVMGHGGAEINPRSVPSSGEDDFGVWIDHNGTKILDTALIDLFNNSISVISSGNGCKIIFFTPCYGGCLLAGNQQVSTSNAFVWCCANSISTCKYNDNYDTRHGGMSYWVSGFLNGSAPGNGDLNADANGDGHTSMSELIDAVYSHASLSDHYEGLEYKRDYLYITGFAPEITSFKLKNGAEWTAVRKVELTHSVEGTPTHYRVAEVEAVYAVPQNCEWLEYENLPLEYSVSYGTGTKTVYFQLKNNNGYSNDCWDQIDYIPLPKVTSFTINNGDSATCSRTVELNNVSKNDPTLYMASESPSFSWAFWKTYSTSPDFILSAGAGIKTVYFKVKNEAGESGVISDQIELKQPPLPPTGLTITNNGQSHSAPRLQWNTSSGASSYKIYRKAVFGDPTWRQIATTTATAYTDYEVVMQQESVAEDKFYYKVRAVNECGSSGDSNLTSTWGFTFD